MSRRADGGPAFPMPYANDSDLSVYAPDGQVVPPRCSVLMQGMSLRDYFAAQCISRPRVADMHPVDAARLAYAMADAMLLQRREG